MTKLLLSVFCLLFILSSSAFACKPGPFPECKKRNLSLNPDKLQGLLMQVDDYQKLLSASLVMPTNYDSCFNKHFAVHYGSIFKEELKTHKGKTCSAQVVTVRSYIQSLIDPESPENLQVFNKTMKKLLNKNAKKIKIGLMILP